MTKKDKNKTDPYLLGALILVSVALYGNTVWYYSKNKNTHTKKNKKTYTASLLEISAKRSVDLTFQMGGSRIIEHHAMF